MFLKKWRLCNEVEEGKDLGGIENTDELENTEEVDNQDNESTNTVDGKDDEEVVVTIGDEPAPEETEKAPEWVRELRKQSREDKKRLREMEAELNRIKSPVIDDFDYDADKFKQAMKEWLDKKRKIEEESNKALEETKAQEKAWQDRLAEYAEMRSALKVQDFEDAESTTQEILNVTQQGILVQGADNPALVVLELGKNPKKTKELAEIKNHFKFAFEIAKLEQQLKVTNKRTPPAPEKTISGSGKSSSSVDNQLDRLRSDAEKSGDYSKVLAYKAKFKKK